MGNAIRVLEAVPPKRHAASFVDGGGAPRVSVVGVGAAVVRDGLEDTIRVIIYRAIFRAKILTSQMKGNTQSLPSLVVLDGHAVVVAVAVAVVVAVYNPCGFDSQVELYSKGRSGRSVRPYKFGVF